MPRQILLLYFVLCLPVAHFQAQELTPQSATSIALAKIMTRPAVKRDLNLGISGTGRLPRLAPPGQLCEQVDRTPPEVGLAKKDKLDAYGIVTIRQLGYCGDWQIQLTDTVKADHIPEDVPGSDSVATGLTVARFRTVSIDNLQQQGDHAIAIMSLKYDLTNTGYIFWEHKMSIFAQSSRFLVDAEHRTVSLDFKVGFSRREGSWQLDGRS